MKTKGFYVGDLFLIKPTKSYGLNNDDLLRTKGEVPVLSNIIYNNGVQGYVDLEPTESGGIITFSDTVTRPNESLFYQPVDFIGYSHVQGMYPLFDKEYLTERVALYIITAIRKATGKKYDYSNKFSRESVAQTMIILPVDQIETPDFVYMEEYITNIERKAISNFEQQVLNQISLMKKVVGLSN